MRTCSKTPFILFGLASTCHWLIYRNRGDTNSLCCTKLNFERVESVKIVISSENHWSLMRGGVLKTSVIFIPTCLAQNKDAIYHEILHYCMSSIKSMLGASAHRRVAHYLAHRGFELEMYLASWKSIKWDASEQPSLKTSSLGHDSLFVLTMITCFPYRAATYRRVRYESTRRYWNSFQLVLSSYRLQPDYHQYAAIEENEAQAWATPPFSISIFRKSDAWP